MKSLNTVLAADTEYDVPYDVSHNPNVGLFLEELHAQAQRQR